jgi:hypothetical protein
MVQAIPSRQATALPCAHRISALVALLLCATPGLAAEPDATTGALAARLEFALRPAGFGPVTVTQGPECVRIVAEPGEHTDPLVALAVLGAAVVRLAPEAESFTLEIARAGRVEASLTTSPAGLERFIAARLNAAQKRALANALASVTWEAAPTAATTLPPVEHSATAATPDPPSPPETTSPTSPPPLRLDPDPDPGSERRDLAERLQAALVGLHLENVRVTARDDELIAEYENRVFRNEMAAVGAVLGAAAEMAPADWRLVIIPKRLDVPVVAVEVPADEARRFMRGGIPARELRRLVSVTQDVGDRRRPQPGEEHTDRAASSAGEVDLTAEPHVTYSLARTEDPFIADVLLRTGAEARLGRGLKGGLRAQLVVDEGRLDLERAHLSRIIRPGDGPWLITTTFGRIRPERNAWHAELAYATGDGRFRVGGSFTRIGEDLFDLDNGLHSRSLLGSAAASSSSPTGARGWT